MRADVSSEVRSSLAADAPPSRQGMPGGGTGGGSGAADAGAPAQGRGACSEGRQDCWQLMATVGRGLQLSHNYHDGSHVGILLPQRREVRNECLEFGEALAGEGRR